MHLERKLTSAWRVSQPNLQQQIELILQPNLST